jgi:hypothetical protein
VRSPVILVTRVGAAAGARAAAAGLACAGTAPDRAGMLIDLGGSRRPRPTLIAGLAARELEERLVSHLPEAGVASRGRICHLSLPADARGLEMIAAALAICRGSVAAVHLAPPLVQPALTDIRLRPSGALLRADLPADRALTALAAGDLMDRGIRTAVLKRPIGWVAARRALAGAVAPGPVDALRQPACRRLLAADQGPG